MPQQLKDMFDLNFVAVLSSAFVDVLPIFPVSEFGALVFDTSWEERELKARMRHITLCLSKALPQNYQEALAILREVAESDRLKPFNFQLMIFPDFVEVHGLGAWDDSIAALEQFTQQSSAEFAVRPFIIADQDRMMAQMLAWAGHMNEHVRRLASEGCRPRLPWAMALPALKKDPTPILPVLERLKLDPSEFVRRSVANNLNDISKDNAQVVRAVLAEWLKRDTVDMQRLASHALRTLIKAGDPGALSLLGYGAADVSVENFQISPAQVEMGEVMAFRFDIVSRSNSDQQLIVDFILYFVRSNGTHSAKVFKLAKKGLPAGERISINKRYSFAPISTRRYYPGEHRIEIQINGEVFTQGSFELVPQGGLTPAE